jgi:voltage-gated potassium channel
MKFLASQLTYILSDEKTRSNFRAFLRYLLVLSAVVAAYAGLFHLVMHYEGQKHTWVTGVYWTLTVMSTLGFGDITFQTDLGRAFSMLVLLTGIVMLLIVLPFAFLRYFYAPWLEAQIRLRAPRGVPAGTSGHVLLCRDDEITRGLAKRLEVHGIPYFFLQPDLAQASEMHGEGVPVVSGEVDDRATYAAAGATTARCVVVNLDDITNTNVTLTVREQAPEVPIIALAEDKDSIDILELSGATHVLDLKHKLGQQLAGRVTAGNLAANVIGRFNELVIAEFPVHSTPFANRAIRDTRLRELTGLNIVGYWEGGRLLPAHPDVVLTTNAVAVVVGTESQILELDAMMVIYKPNENPVVVIGGGKIGRACARALKKRDIRVHLIERNAQLEGLLGTLADRVLVGDAADLDVVTQAGIADAPSVVLSTNDDATNIYLAVYCRRLNPDIHIVSRITHERNIEAIHRAGANLVLSYSSLGVQLIMSVLLGRELVMLGEGVDFLVLDVPKALAGRTLAESGIGAKTGLNVIGRKSREGTTSQPGPATVLELGDQLVALGSAEQRRQFEKAFRSK